MKPELKRGGWSGGVVEKCSIIPPLVCLAIGIIAVVLFMLIA